MTNFFKREWQLFKTTVNKDRFVRFASVYDARNVQKIENTSDNFRLIEYYRRSQEWVEV